MKHWWNYIVWGKNEGLGENPYLRANQMDNEFFLIQLCHKYPPPPLM